jgi:hypothetical protein
VLDRPVVVLVANATGGEGFDKLEEVVFKNEKIGLAMKAFRAVRMSPEDAAADPILQGQGDQVPRLAVIDPVKEDVKVLEGSRIKVSALYAAMKSAAGRFWKERLDDLVKDHLKLLTERDQLANEIKVLQDKEGRLEGDARKLAAAKAEREAVEARLAAIAERERALWTLTPKTAAV